MSIFSEVKTKLNSLYCVFGAQKQNINLCVYFYHMKTEGARDHIAANLGIETEDFDYAPFAQEDGLGKVYQLFGDELNGIMEELNEALAE